MFSKHVKETIISLESLKGKETLSFERIKDRLVVSNFAKSVNCMNATFDKNCSGNC